MTDEVGTSAAFLDDRRVEKLITLIRDTFRIRENHDPVYVDVGDNLDRVGAAQHLIVFGRRGSGKSCLLVHHHRQARRGGDVLSIYIQADEVKTLSLPDLLIQLMLGVFQEANSARRGWRRFVPRRHGPLDSAISELQQLLDQATEQEVTEGSGWTDRADLGGGIATRGARLSRDTSSEATGRRETKFKELKLESLERHLAAYKSQLRLVLDRSGYRHATVLIDDFYLIKPALQPDVIDYAHRLFRGTAFYLKIGTVRHRTILSRHIGSAVGVELYQDVEELDLDQTFEDVERTKDYLQRMLDSLAERVGIDQFSARGFNPDGLLDLALASGGVPRDFFTIFVEAVKIARSQGDTKWLTPKTIYRGAGRVSYRTKLTNLRKDVGSDAQPLELVFQDLMLFCLKEKQKTAFLVAQAEVAEYADEHELIKQLMDFKLIHVIEPDTSAASGRSGRYEAYTLDFSLFMEPRLRGIEHVQFWRIDEQRRRRGVRELPVYLLARAKAIAYGERGQTTEQVVQQLEQSIGVDPD